MSSLFSRYDCVFVLVFREGCVGGAYTKHIYAASQRIASKLGSIDAFGADPRRAERTKRVDFIGKFDVQTNAIKDRHEALGFEYDAKDRKSNFDKDSVGYASTGDSREAEKLVFFYHPDHLGSTSYVTDLDGNVTQHIEYIPYGEVFIEERNNAFATSYLFNAKELDEETGMYYYGARYLEPNIAMWISVDPLGEKNIGASPYNYCHGNPVVMVDPDGRFDVEYKGNCVNETEQKKKFNSLISKMSNLLADKGLLKNIEKTTGLSENKIISDFSYNSTAKIIVSDEYNDGPEANNNAIHIPSNLVKWFCEDYEDKNISLQTGSTIKVMKSFYRKFATIMAILHEYAHYGDQQTNDNFNTGQYKWIDGKQVCYTKLEEYKNTPYIKTEGKQGFSTTGHRGLDITSYFGVDLSWNFIEKTLQIELYGDNATFKNWISNNKFNNLLK